MSEHSSTKGSTVVSEHDARHVTFASYVIGFGLSLLCTLSAYVLTVRHALSSHVLAGLVVTFALAQFVVQLMYFLHLGREFKPRWKLVVFVSMLVAVVIIVFGSIWIMANLNYNMMSPSELKHYLRVQEGL
jgi:cytochrome o ubiquinol oxidase operon protein cyoD